MSSLEAKNKHRAELGLDPLPEPAPEPSSEPAAPAPAAAAPAAPSVAAPAAEPGEMDDATLLSILEKRNIKVSSLDELRKAPTEEDVRAQQAQREADKLSWGFQNKKISKEQYDGYVADSANIRNLVFEDFRAQAITDDPEMSEEDIQAEFADRFGETSEPDSRRFKRGQKEMGIIADRLLHNKYAQVYGLEGEYAAHENQSRTQREEAQRILSQAPKYKADVESVIQGLRVQKDSIHMGNGVPAFESTFQVPEEAIQEVANIMLSEGFSRNQISKGWTNDDLRMAADYLLFQRIRPTLLSSTAKSYASAEFTKRYGERKGVFPEREPGKLPPTEFTDKQTAWRKELGLGTNAPTEPVAS